MIKRTIAGKLAGLCLAATVALVSGCASEPKGPEPIKKAAYQEFTDITWLPEDSVRAPAGAQEREIDQLSELRAGIHAFYDTHESVFFINGEGPEMIVAETKLTLDESCFNWGAGAATLYRWGARHEAGSAITAREMPDGRILMMTNGTAPFAMAVKLRAWDVSGKPVRQVLRNANNQPEDLAWFMTDESVFPQGSLAYVATYWLAADEIVQPSSSAFTGAANLERLMAAFSGQNPFCLGYVSHQYSNPYGVIFQSSGRKLKNGSTGAFSFVEVDENHPLCRKDTDPKVHAGSWVVREVQGTRVLELLPNENVHPADIGVQPVNAKSIGVGFAQISADQSAKRKSRRTTVVPVRIIRAESPVVDLRVKFNGVAAKAVLESLQKAGEKRKLFEAQEAAAQAPQKDQLR